MTPLDFAAKVVMVTGASKGIGAAITRDLLARGASVAALAIDRPSPSDDAQAAGPTPCLHAIECDVRSAESVDHAVSAVLGRFGRIDALVNNAGVYPTTAWSEMTEDAWDQVMDTNLKGAFLCTQAVARSMVSLKLRGAIVNVSSTAALVARPGIAHYAASKAGLNAMTRVLALELAPHGIRVNAIAPGLIATEGARSHAATVQGATELRAKLSRVPLGAEGTPEDVASLVLYLLSDASQYITGSIMVVDGGYSLGIPAEPLHVDSA